MTTSAGRVASATGVVLLTLAAGQFVMALDTTVMNTAIAAKPLATAAGCILLGRLTTQLVVIGYRSPLQPAVLCRALATLALARRL